MIHPYYSTDSYIFWWLFLPCYFYLIYIIPFFLRKYCYIVIYSAIIAGTLLILFLSGSFVHSIILYPISAVIFSFSIRYLQLNKKTHQGKKKSLNTIWLYIILPLVGAGFWPTYLIYPAVTKYWATRPSEECKNNGRLIALSSNIIYRIYPNYGNSFWVDAPNLDNQPDTGGLFNVSTKEFCHSFSASVPRLVSEIDFSFYDLCDSPQTKNQKIYCNRVQQGGIELNRLELKLSSQKNFDYIGWQGLQNSLEKNIKRIEPPFYYGDWIQTIKADNHVVLHEFYGSQIQIAIENPSWLINQPEPVVLGCTTNYEVRCSTTYMYHNGWHIEYLYYLAKNNADYHPDEELHHYDQAYINKQIEAARQAAQIAVSILEEMRE